MSYENGVITEESYRESIFVGRSGPEDEGGPTLEKAFEDAYERAKAGGKRPPFKVLDTWVNGTNPLSEYIVALKAGN